MTPSKPDPRFDSIREAWSVRLQVASVFVVFTGICALIRWPIAGGILAASGVVVFVAAWRMGDLAFWTRVLPQRSWSRMIAPEGDYWRRILIAEGHGGMVPELEAKARVAIAGVRADSIHPGAGTRFGGFPDVGDGFVWPCDKTGQPMRFVAQVALAEIPPVLPLPRQGLLQFFYSCRDAWPERMMPDVQGVVLFQKRTEGWGLTPDRSPSLTIQVEPETVRFRVFEDLPDTEQEPVRDVRMMARVGSCFQLMGYADQDGRSGPYPEDSLLLFQTHNPDQFEDGGVDLHFLIAREDLAAGRFSMAWGQGWYAI